MARLETAFRPALKQPPTEADVAFTSALGKLLETMDQKHARIVMEDVASLRDPTTTPGARFSDLTVAAILCVEGTFERDYRLNATLTTAEWRKTLQAILRGSFGGIANECPRYCHPGHCRRREEPGFRRCLASSESRRLKPNAPPIALN